MIILDFRRIQSVNLYGLVFGLESFAFIIIQFRQIVLDFFLLLESLGLHLLEQFLLSLLCCI